MLLIQANNARAKSLRYDDLQDLLCITVIRVAKRIHSKSAVTE
jgi:hypothetical protein